MSRFALLALLLVGLSTAGVVAGTDLVDFDGDGVSAVTELRAGTDVLAEDSDGDRLGDGAELRTSSDPTDPDTDDDGLNDAAERFGHDTDPTDTDTDSDGLDDGEEVHDYGTEPTDTDTDGDGLSDAAERSEHGTDPTDPDSDDDGVEDGRELELATDPLTADTDGDELDDGAELDIGSDPLTVDTDDDGVTDDREDVLGTDPVDLDTDDDGLDDEPEVNGRTDATDSDSDDDGLDDGAELEVGTDPTDADTDDDGLEDGWEVEGETDRATALPGSDPLRMDMYVDVRYTEGVSQLSDRQLRYVQRTWADFDVENPDGTTGIAVHIGDEMGDSGRLSDDYVVRSERGYDVLEGRYDPAEGNMRRDDAYHRVVIVEIRSTDFDGYGDIGGRFSIADPNGNTEEVVVHELLHNVVGKLDYSHRCEDAHHTCEGWLRSPIQTFMTEGVLAELRRDGLTPAH